MSMFGRGVTEEDGSLVNPVRSKSRGARNRRSRRPRNKPNKRKEGDGAPPMRAQTARMDAFMLTDGSDAEQPSMYAAAPSDHYATDARSGARAADVAKQHQRQVRRSMYVSGAETDDQTSDYSELDDERLPRKSTKRGRNARRSRNASSSDDDDDDDSSGECDVPDDVPPPGEPKRARRSHSPFTGKKRGGKRFGMPTESIDLAQDARISAPVYAKPPTATTTLTSTSQSGAYPAGMRQIQRSVRRANNSTGPASSWARQQHSVADSSQSSATSSGGDILIDGDDDYQRLEACMNAFLITMRENPYYQYATGVAVSLGKSDEMTFIDNQTERILAAIMPKKNSRQSAMVKNSTYQAREDAKLLRSAAYFLKSHIDADYTASGQKARKAALHVAAHSLDSVRAIQQVHQRMNQALQLARPYVHRRIYLSDKLIPFTGQAMEELYRAGLDQAYSADDVIMHGERVRNAFAALTAAKMASNYNSVGSVPFVQIQMVANISKVARHAKEVVRLMQAESGTAYDFYSGYQQSMRNGDARAAETRFAAPSSYSGPPLPLPDNSTRSIARLLRRRR